MADAALIAQLQKQILGLQGNRTVSEPQLRLGLGALETAFPSGVFPSAAVHEFISTSSQQAACTSGFISVILSKLMQHDGVCVWISTKPRRAVFPPALKAFGIEPHRILFVDTGKPKQTLWAVEEALKCTAVSAVVGELNELDFNDSRRLQLAVEESRVTGLLHRFRPKVQNAVACVSRWKISSLPCESPEGLPGLGFPRWKVQLLKVRNGQPGEWHVQWSPTKGLEYLSPTSGASQQPERQTG